MCNDKIKANWKILALIVIIILAGAGMAAVQGYMKDNNLRIVPVEKHIQLDSEKGKILIDAAEKTLTDEGIDTRYLLPSYIIEGPYNPYNPPIIRFRGTETFYEAIVYTNNNLTDSEAFSVFAADLRRYHIDNQSYGEIWEYGKNYTLTTGNNTLEIFDNASGKVKLKVLNYSIFHDKDQTGVMINDINHRFETAWRDFRMNADEPAIIIDAPSQTGNLKNRGDLLFEITFCDSSPCIIRVEDKSQEIEGNGWVDYNITYRIKYLNPLEWP